MSPLLFHKYLSIQSQWQWDYPWQFGTSYVERLRMMVIRPSDFHAAITLEDINKRERWLYINLKSYNYIIERRNEIDWTQPL